MAVAALATLPSDAVGFFLLSGLHLIACGMLGAICSWGKLRAPIRYLFCGTSMLVNAALAVRIALLVFDGTIRGPLIVAVPFLLGTPAVLNVVAAASNPRRVGPTNT